jgi:hypothetical protein
MTLQPTSGSTPDKLAFHSQCLPRPARRIFFFKLLLVIEKVPPKAILVTCAGSCGERGDRLGSDFIEDPIRPERMNHLLKRVIPFNLMS